MPPLPHQTTWRVAVIGAGVSGLAAAHRLLELCREAGRPLDLTVFEAGPRTGGVVGTRRVGEYLVELGADSFITNKPWALDLCLRLGLEDQVIPTEARFRRSLVVSRGKPVPVPDGFQLLAPANVGAVLRSPIFSWRGKLRLGLECLIPGRRDAGDDESLAEFVRRRLGREALERLIQPLVGGIYTSDPEKLSLRATMPRFLEMEQAHGSVIRALRRQRTLGGEDDASGARYGLFATLRLGMTQLLEALAKQIATQAAVRLDTPVERIIPEPDGRGFTLELPDGARDGFDAVVLAVPAYRAAELIHGFAPVSAAALREIEYASTAIVVSGHRLDEIEHPLDAFGLVVPAIERRRILAVSFASRKFPGRAPEGRVILRTFVGGAMQPELMRLSDDEMKALVREELAQLLGVRGSPEFAMVARWNRSMPQYHVGHLRRVATIEGALESFPRLGLAGNALRGVGLPDSIHSGEQAAERVFAAAD